MTRLCDEWLLTITNGLFEYENELRCKTGLDFLGMSAAANGLAPEVIREMADKHTISVIPVTAGKGVIAGFSEAVAGIIHHTGFRVFLTESTDVDGIYEAYSRNARFIFMADDRRYIGFDLEHRHVTDNSAATARGFVTALSAMCKDSLENKDVLILGCGIVGRYAAASLLEKRARPVLYDKTPIAQDIGKQLAIPYILSAEEISGFQYILDATNEGNWLKRNMLHKDVYIAAPGVPLSLDTDAYAQHSKRLVHDLLHIGTLTMLGELSKQ